MLRPRHKRSCDSRAPADAGFSLVEALVALGVFALAGVGLIMVQTQAATSHQALETRTLAGLVAQNVLVEVASLQDAPPLGARSGAAALAGRSWQYSLDVSPTPDARTRRVRVQVREAESRVIGADLTAFVPAGQDAPP